VGYPLRWIQGLRVRLFVAYLDAGSGSLLLQALAGGVAGVAVVGKLYWRRFKRLLVRRGTSDEAR
jgi:hypothetical protein